MPEPIDEWDDRELREAFAMLRREARGQIQAPGPAAAQRDVAHRRRVRVAVLAAAVVAIVGGAFAAVARPHGDTVGRPTPTASAASVPATSLPPTLDSDDLAALGQAALDELGGADRSDGLWASGGLSGGVVIGFGGDDNPLPAGQYDLAVECVGAGSLRVDVAPAPGDRDNGFTVACGPLPDAKPVFTSLREFDGGRIQVTIAADAVALGRAGFGLWLIDPIVMPARSALGDLGPAALFSSSDPLDTTPVGSSSVGSPAGRYQLRLACAGTGRVRATFSVGQEQRHTYELECTPTGAALTLPNGSGDDLVIDDPDQELRLVIERVAGDTRLGAAWAVVKVD